MRLKLWLFDYNHYFESQSNNQAMHWNVKNSYDIVSLVYDIFIRHLKPFLRGDRALQCKVICQ